MESAIMGTKGTCKLDGCEGDVRGKGYCERHYRAWRRGKLPKARYRTCNEDGCHKPVMQRMLCEEHFRSKYVKAKEAEGAPAEAAAPASEASGEAPGEAATSEAPA
jgi:hypothetical protein